jgi:hypothetical protein
MNIAGLLANRESNIMVYATPDSIAQEREALSKWFDGEWSKIPRQTELVKALLTDCGDDALAKVAPAEALDITTRAHQLKAKHGRDAKFWATIAQGEEMAKVLGEHNDRSAQLDRLERRSSDLRFAIPAPPVQHHSGHH